MIWRVGAGIVGVMVVWVSVLGCGSPDPEMRGNPGPARVAELENQLRAKPPLEVAQREYGAAMNQVAEQIAALVPGMTWRVEENTADGCGGEYVWTRAVYVYYYIVFDRAIP